MAARQTREGQRARAQESARRTVACVLPVDPSVSNIRGMTRAAKMRVV